MSYPSVVPKEKTASTGERFGFWDLFDKKTAEGKKRPVIGSWLMLPGANLARMVASQGFDWILVDCEHGDISDSEMHAQVAAIGNAGCAPMVRVVAPEQWLVKRALDTGAFGLLCPMMNTAEEARKFVSYAKFPNKLDNKPDPLKATKYSALDGVRGAGSPFAPALWNRDLQTYLDTANDGIFIAVQIESKEGLENCEEIAQVEGVDMLFVGPNDLANSLGYKATDHPKILEVQDAIARVLAAAHKHGKKAGMFCMSADQVLERVDQGFDLMNMGMDFGAMQSWNAEHLDKVKHVR